VPCPLCGGLIHPVAGRCKHCKQDLSALRSGRPAAATPLPPLQQVPASAPIAVPVAREDTPSQPILPPRPTARSVAAQQPTGTRVRWSSWPMIVIILAVAAIIGAVAIMVWPEHRGPGEHTLKAPPAPERMDTDPLPPPGAGNPNGADPWSNGANGNANNAPHSQVVPRSTPDPLPPQPPQQPDDDQFGFGNLMPGNGAVIGGGGGSPDFMFAAMGHACNKLKTCPNADDTLKSICDVYSQFPPSAPPANCAPAQRCLEAIDNMSCSQSGYGSPLSVVNMFQDCTKAITSC